MTHTLHRRGTTDSLSRDYPIIAMPCKEKNNADPQRLGEILRVFLKHQPRNLGQAKIGNNYRHSLEEMLETMGPTTNVMAVYDDRAVVEEVIRELKEREFGVSIVVSGVFEEVSRCAHRTRTEVHTVDHSGGILGALNKLPDEELLQVTTMCGHAMVPAGHVRQMIIDIKAGRRTYREAADDLAAPCHCGVFNPARAEELLRDLVATWCVDED